MILLSVGTIMPFDRLTRAVDEAIGAGIINEPVFGQIGETTFKPKHMEYAVVLDRHVFDQKVSEARCMISHAGIGSITLAMEHNKPLLVIPRKKCFREHVNDHQVSTARKFGDLGHVLVTYDVADLPSMLHELFSFVPRPRTAEPGKVIERISRFIEQTSP
jgi:UDP-N-acetylglucosamine transferase subunit ALG13